VNPELEPTILEVSHLSKAYGEVQAVADLSFSVRSGEIFGFLGPNGAGKTTTIKMMCGLLRPDRGSVTIKGSALRKGGWKGSRRIGVCPQHIVIWETMTCMEQLEFMGRMYDVEAKRARRKAEELLEVFGLVQKKKKLARTLSGGMQRRLNIALALVHEPEILFLDEPQAGLDPQSRVLVRDYVKSLAGAMTVVLTTHDMEEAEKLSDRVCIIDGGKLLVVDTVENIKNQLGQGDFFEIELAGNQGRELLASLPGGTERFRLQGQTLQLISHDAVTLLPQVLQAIKEQGLLLEHLRIRKKNLEDVFISLTGRGLRQ